MNIKKKHKRGIHIMSVLAAVIVCALFLMLGPPGLLAKSESPLFCTSCHVMGGEYQAWSHAGAHRQQKCVDCHLPNDSMLSHYTWKAIDGMKDTIAFYSGDVAARITISGHGEKVVQKNCIRCHESTVQHIDQKRLCWGCHRRVAHRGTGAIMTL